MALQGNTLILSHAVFSVSSRPRPPRWSSADAGCGFVGCSDLSLSVLCSDGRGRFGDGRSGGELLPPRGRSGGNCGEGLSDGRM